MMLGARPTMLEQLFGGNNNALGCASCRLSKINMGCCSFSEVKQLQMGSKTFVVKAANNNKKQGCAKSGGVTPRVFTNRAAFLKKVQKASKSKPGGKTCQRCSTNLDSEGATASVRPVYDGYKRWRDIETKVFLWWRDPWDLQQATKTGAHASISRGSRRTNSPSWPCRKKLMQYIRSDILTRSQHVLVASGSHGGGGLEA